MLTARSATRPVRRPESDSEFIARVRVGGATFAVIGLGYTGLPVAHGLADHGATVVGVDLDVEKVNLLARHKSYLPHLSDQQLAKVRNRFRASTDVSDVSQADVIFVCVPTPLTGTGEPDLTTVRTALAQIAPILTHGTTVILQSTVPPGTTVAEAQRLADSSMLSLGEGLFVAFSSERIDPANSRGWTATNVPRVVGGVTDRCSMRAHAAIELLCGNAHLVRDPITAELSKLLENTFRLVNISLANEFADVCRNLGVPVREVIDAAATKPFGYLPHVPGPGIGGECIPVDPVFLLNRERQAWVPMPLTELAHGLAMSRPTQVVQRTLESLAKGGHGPAAAHALILGVAYKANVDDVRNAPALYIIERLLDVGVAVDYCDPHVPSVRIGERELHGLPYDPSMVQDFDCVVLITPHDVFADLDWSSARLIVDTQGTLHGLADHVVPL